MHLISVYGFYTYYNTRNVILSVYLFIKLKIYINQINLFRILINRTLNYNLTKLKINLFRSSIFHVVTAGGSDLLL